MYHAVVNTSLHKETLQNIVDSSKMENSSLRRVFVLLDRVMSSYAHPLSLKEIPIEEGDSSYRYMNSIKKTHIWRNVLKANIHTRVGFSSPIQFLYIQYRKLPFKLKFSTEIGNSNKLTLTKVIRRYVLLENKKIIQHLYPNASPNV